MACPPLIFTRFLTNPKNFFNRSQNFFNTNFYPKTLSIAFKRTFDPSCARWIVKSFQHFFNKIFGY